MTEAIFTESLGAWIVRNREELAITQLRLAAALRVKRATVSAWERGTRTVSAYDHLRLTAYFEQCKAGKEEKGTT